jgi:hypothetical protein
VPEDSNLESRFEALRKEFVNEFQHTREIAHRLVDDFTAISGYAEIMIVRGGPAENAISESRKILDRAKKSMGLLQKCISNLDELARKH